MIAEGDIRIRILGKDADSVYRVEAQTDDGSFFQDQMQLAAAEQASLVASEGDNLKYGSRLAQLLFSPKILGAYQQTLGRAKAGGSGRVRIRLWISSDCAELHAYAWERLLLEWDGKQVAAACSPALPFSRYTGLARPEPQPLRERAGRLRLLIAVSNPTGLPEGFEPIAVRSELDQLLEVLKLVDGLRVTVLPGRTCGSTEEFGDFQAKAREWKDAGFRVQPGAVSAETLAKSLANQDIIHILGHGAYSPKTRGSLLFLENDDGSLNMVKENDVVSLIMNLSPLPQLLFLASCDGAKRPLQDARAFVSIGPKLVEAGFPAVVAMQSKAPMALAHRLTLEFYRNLLDHGTIDLALNQARSLLFSTEGADWSIPVLFMRVPDGRLFTPDPTRSALHAMAEGPVFADRPIVSDLPLEAVVLSGQQLSVKLNGETLENRVPAGWERAVRNALYRVDLLKQIHAIAAAIPETPAYNLSILVGDDGAEKGGFLRRFVRETAAASLERRSDRQLVPLYVNLANYPSSRAGSFGRLEALLLASLQSFLPDPMSEADFHSRLQERDLAFRFVFDNGDDLPSPVREEILREVQRLAEALPGHQYFFAMEPGCWNLDDLPVTALVALQPLARHKVESFLRAQTGELQPAMINLAGELARAGLYDLAARPWLLLRMAGQALQGRMPRGRAQVLQSLLDDGIQQIPVERGQQSRARESLYALALRMQLTYRSSLPAYETFETLAEVRGNREYNLEELLACLTGQDLLEQTPEGSVRFPYPFVQSFCSALALKSSREGQTLEQVTAGLGRPKYLKWWEECLVLLSGLIEEKDREPLLRQIAYGSTLTEGEHLFLAARCLHESGLAGKGGAIADQILDALIWRSDAGNEKRIPRRVLAVRALGELSRPEALAHLTRIARLKVRRAWDGAMSFEYGAVRQAAVRALYRLPAYWEQIEDQALTGVLRYWRGEDVQRLAGILCSRPDSAEGSEKASLSGLAAFALGDLQYMTASREALYAAFLSPATEVDARWSIADAFLALDPEEVKQRVIMPGTQPGAPESLSHSGDWVHLMLYLITQLRLPDPWALEYVEGVLADPRAITGCKGRALLALGMLNAQNWRDRLVQTALHDFTAIQARADDPESDYLRQKALEALAEIGTINQLEALRKGRSTTQWTPELIRVFYDTSEIISSRENDLS